jgi:hypothetical protein
MNYIIAESVSPRLKAGIVLATMFFLTACAGPREVAQEPGAANVADYEDFDPTPYRPEPLAAAPILQHDVPEELMEGHVDAPTRPVTPRTMQGYRIQIMSTPQKPEADRMVGELSNWWRTHRTDPSVPSNLFPEEIPVYVIFTQPDYRVRIGNYASRQQADAALRHVRSRFPDAWIVPDTVTIR